MTVEPGVTVQKILKICLNDNWMLAAVPGTRLVTIGGCASNNIHGKNSYRDGNFGDHIIEFDIINGILLGKGSFGKVYKCNSLLNN